MYTHPASIGIYRKGNYRLIFVPEAGDEMVQKDGGLEPCQVEPRAQPLAAAEGGEAAAAAAAHDRYHVGPLLPPPGVEGVRVVVDGGVEVDGAEVDEDAPALGDEVAPHLHVPHRLPHDPVYDVAHPQRLRDHLN